MLGHLVKNIDFNIIDDKNGVEGDGEKKVWVGIRPPYGVSETNAETIIMYK